MSLVINILFVLNALLLVGVVLIQQPKTSGGLFSGTGQSLLGTSGKPFWTKFTVILAGVFMVLCVLMAKFPGAQGPQSSVADIIEKQNQPPAAAAPASGANPAASGVKPSTSNAAPAPQVPAAASSNKPQPASNKK